MRAARHERRAATGAGDPTDADAPVLSLVPTDRSQRDEPATPDRTKSFAQALRAFAARCPEPGCGRRGCPGPSYHAAQDRGWWR
jgi:hypothetical protein